MLFIGGCSLRYRPTFRFFLLHESLAKFKLNSRKYCYYLPKTVHIWCLQILLSESGGFPISRSFSLVLNSSCILQLQLVVCSYALCYFYCSSSTLAAVQSDCASTGVPENVASIPEYRYTRINTVRPSSCNIYLCSGIYFELLRLSYKINFSPKFVNIIVYNYVYFMSQTHSLTQPT